VAEQSWDRILTCVGKRRYPKRCQLEKLEQFNRESPDEKRVEASLAFIFEAKARETVPRLLRLVSQDQDSNPAGE
jgi:hypothetical protein